MKMQTIVRSLLLSLAAIALILVPTALQATVFHRAGSILLENAVAVEAAAQPENLPSQVQRGVPQTPSALPAYTPPQEYAPADPTNYGQRFTTDIHGRPVSNQLIVVIHETVGSASSAINRFQTPHPRDADQASYHSLIKRDGTIVYLVSPEMRAFGAGNSVFNGSNGAEAVQTNAAFPPSVNNFAYHTSLESPADGRGNSRRHSGYTDAQYRSLAWIVAQTHVPDERITTHQAVDRSGTRLDPRSFDMQRFFTLLHADSEGSASPLAPSS